MLAVIMVALAAIASIMFNVTSLGFIKRQVRQQQMAQDVDGLFQASVTAINARFTKAGGVQQFLRTYCSPTANPNIANPSVTTDCFDTGFKTNFGFSKSGPANLVRQKLNMILWPNNSYRMDFNVVVYKTGGQPNDFIPITGATKLYDLSHITVRMSVLVPDNGKTKTNRTIRRFDFTIPI